jgi:Dockerin type I domain
LSSSTGTTVTATPLVTTTFTVTGTASSGCVSTATSIVNVVDCNDGNVCTVDGIDAVTGAVSHLPVNVDDGDPCTADGCNSITGIFHNPICGVTLNSSIFIQGYYSGSGLMEIAGVGTLFIDQVPGASPTDADTVRISAMSATSPYALVQEQLGILHTDGAISVTFNSPVVPGNSYYLRVIHRNCVETWSSASVMMSGVTTYSFSSSASQAFAGNLADLGDGNFAIYSGDLNHDGAVDGSDFLELDPSIQSGDGGYMPGDMNGDGAVDGSDFLVLDPNIQTGIGAAVPTP